MGTEIGSTVEGIVLRLADYGAIVRISGGKIGLVHISEIADTYVRDVRDYFSENDRVLVKILKINDRGRYELSAKQAGKITPVQTQRTSQPPKPNDSSERPLRLERHEKIPVTFEDKISRFMKDSEERQLDLKKHIEAKRGGHHR